MQSVSAIGNADYSNKITIRDATKKDLKAIQEIYAFHVLHGTASFEELAPSEQELQRRYTSITSQGLPWLVAILDKQIIGYCYAGPYRPRAAYRFTVENTIYLRADCTGKGTGKALLSELILRCEKGPWRQMIAVISGHANQSSVALHRSLGFQYVGTQTATGYKFKQWLDVVFMQRALGDGSNTPPDDR
ncbi:GNAT family N-acetyltransferase [Paenalcaligenes niemegkensis]|uniref:GNAT family N-acetyltransferase n=1 Tax=Paenalcaligenes niemegkensis TaxID=2895469 RepID=UPI001EE78604|nr:GNAT family N-acetyltransferase [Paenalcaligenes niemegkensis]MCQ9617204.1 GNAT family N-acetyltransferase [Paenalcaligenes niemegkensis]